MRKRLVIGAIAAVVIGVAAYMLSQPRKGTVEWDKKEYLRCMKGPPLERAVNFVRRMLGMQPSYRMSVAQMDKEKQHRKALVDLGYLVATAFVVSNQTADEVLASADRAARADPRYAGVKMEFLHTEHLVSYATTNTAVRRDEFVIVAHRDDAQFIAEAIRKADVPETK